MRNWNACVRTAGGPSLSTIEVAGLQASSLMQLHRPRPAARCGRLLGAGLLVYAAGLHAAPPQQPSDGTAIARQVDAVNRFEQVRNIGYGQRRRPVVVIDRSAPGRVLVNTFQRWRNNDVDGAGVSARDLVIFRSGKLRGTGILVTDYAETERTRDYLMWLPSLRKLRRFVEPDAADRWGNSNFSYGDIYIRRVEDEAHELLGRETFRDCLGAVELTDDERDRYTRNLPKADCSVQGRAVFRLRSRPHRTDLGYDERITWVDVGSFADYRSVYYRDGGVVKVIDKSWRRMQVPGSEAPYWVYWYAHTPESGQEGMAYVDPAAVTWNSDIEADFWSARTLRKIRR